MIEFSELIMNTNNMSLHNILTKLNNSTLERNELNYLIDKCNCKAKGILRSKYSSFYSSNKYEMEELDNIAKDAIVQLFVSNSADEYAITSSLKNWNMPIDSEVESEFFLFKVISRRVDQTVTEFLKQKDPIFEKILNTLNVCVNNNNFKKITYFGSIYILDKSIDRIDGKIISPEEFNLIPESYFKLKQKQLFDSIYEYLRNGDSYCLAIPLNELARRVKLHYLNAQKSAKPKEQCLNTEFIFQELVEIGLESVKNKLDSYYVSSDILTITESLMIFEAFKNISSDMLNIGAYDKLYKYIHDYDESITKEVYYLKYRNIMKYLLLDLKLKVSQNFK